jgi:putative glutamine amidotransferase
MSRAARPVIGVTVSRRSGWRMFPLIALNVWLAGGCARRWQAGRAADIGAVDGVIIGGGDDISPDLYGGRLVTSARLDPGRDALERAVVLEAFAQGRPVLGICRGSQMLNIALGGSLHQDAYATYAASDHRRTILPRKRVHLEPGTRLGVQWHPEHLFYAHRQMGIFRALVAAARACRESRAQLPGVDAAAP